MAIYSHSKLSTFESCPLKYKFRYIDKIQKDEQTIEAFMGSRVHDVLEKLYSDLKFQKLLSLKSLLAYYAAIWKKQWNDKIIIVKKEYTEEDYKKIGEICIINYYNSNQPFDKDSTIAVEKLIIIKLDENHKLRGYIDRLSKKNGIYEIHDYKTSSSLPFQEHIDKDRQLALYSIAIKNLFRDALKIKLIWHYLSFNKELKSTRTDEELEKLKKDIIEIIDKIETTKEFNPNVTKLCDYCEFKDICPKWN